jgi:prepilin-type N-terminal cleavage/methylation domain-containing protein/prepilin-type processing-associated H-X9-DG protein
MFVLWNKGSCAMRKRGFTLIELLVVIALLALLMAILLPTLQRVRRQAKAVACQANLRQWGTHWAMRTNENDGYFPGCGPEKEYWWHQPQEDLPWNAGLGWGLGWYGSPYDEPDWYQSSEGIWCCPMATKLANPGGQLHGPGGTFLAWGRFWPKGQYPWDMYGSYGINGYTLWPYWTEETESRFGHTVAPYHWSTPHVKGASNVPMQLDSSMPGAALPREGGDPPVCDAIPTESARPVHGPPVPRGPRPPDPEYGGYGDTPSCINRHDGYVNALFFDWSVRKVGLKELWTLKWHRQFNTAGRWTRAGGVQPGDWPEWMRNFKDY